MAGQVTDAVEFRVVCVKRHLSHVEGLYDEVVAHSISRFLNMTMVLELLAVFEGGDTTLLHPDRGRQYRMPAYRLSLGRMGVA